LTQNVLATAYATGNDARDGGAIRFGFALNGCPYAATGADDDIALDFPTKSYTFCFQSGVIIGVVLQADPRRQANIDGGNDLG
jgi:hypothetical protein